MTITDRVRLRLKEELLARHISQRDLADALSRRDSVVWTQSRVGKVLAGHVELKMEDVEKIADAVGLTMVEVVRDRGLEFYAEMTPTEVRIIERMRQRPHILAAMMTLLDIAPPSAHAGKQAATAGQKRRGPGRPRNSETLRESS